MRNFAQKAAAYYAGARHRAQRRKSLWNALLIPFNLGACVGVGYALFRLVWLFHVTLYPDHRLENFWQSGISFRAFVPSFLMAFSIAPAAIAVGGMLTNVFFWMLYPVRRIFDAEARAYPGTSFQESMQVLFKVSCWTLPIGLAIACAAASFSNRLR